jgi:hypothetical protein
MKITVFWVAAPCSLVEVYRRFRGACYLHHQGVSNMFNLNINIEKHANLMHHLRIMGKYRIGLVSQAWPSLSLKEVSGRRLGTQNTPWRRPGLPTFLRESSYVRLKTLKNYAYVT